MSVADELLKLDDLRNRGVLTAEEFERLKAKLVQGDPTPPPAVQAINRLRRSARDRWLGGVCGGLATATGADSWLWRLIFVLLALLGGTGVVLYILLWILVPSE